MLLWEPETFCLGFAAFQEVKKDWDSDILGRFWQDNRAKVIQVPPSLARDSEINT